MKYEDNIEEICSSSPDYMGFIFYSQSKRYAQNDLKPNTIKGIPKSTIPVAVFVNETFDKISTICEHYRFTHIQLHGNESPEFCKQLKDAGFTVIKAIPSNEIQNQLLIESYQPHVDFLLFDTSTEHYGGSGKQFDWNLLDNYNNQTPLFLSGGIGPKDVENLIENPMVKSLNIEAVDINSCFELKPGLKNKEEVYRFITKLRDAIYS